MAVLLGSSVGLLAQTHDPSSSPSLPSPERSAAQQESARPAAAGATGGRAAETASGQPYTSPCPVTVGSKDADKKGISTGLLIEKVLPKYPRAARKAHIQGTVVLCAEVSKKGTIQNLRAISGPQELIPPAMEAVRKWRYRPYRWKNEPVAVNTEIHVDFSLPQ
jgi:protein TonB